MSDSLARDDDYLGPLIRPEDVSTPAHAALFLDVNLNQERDWPRAVGRTSAFRIPKFRERYEGLLHAIIASPQGAEAGIDNEQDFENLFCKQARAVARQLHANSTVEWSETGYGPNQIRHAVNHELMRFDKAVITALAFNEVSKRFNFIESWSLKPHKLVACVFYFANLYGRIRRLGSGSSGSEDDQFEAGLEQLAAGVNQPNSVLRFLAGSRPKKETTASYQEAATHLASFPTLHAIFCYLAVHQADLRHTDLRSVIVRRRVGGKRMEALADEIIERAGMVTHGPYAWKKSGHRIWPPICEFPDPDTEGK